MTGDEAAHRRWLLALLERALAEGIAVNESRSDRLRAYVLGYLVASTAMVDEGRSKAVWTKLYGVGQ